MLGAALHLIDQLAEQPDIAERRYRTVLQRFECFSSPRAPAGRPPPAQFVLTQ
jgi:hypothetical protein